MRKSWSEVEVNSEKWKSILLDFVKTPRLQFSYDSIAVLQRRMEISLLKWLDFTNFNFLSSD